MCLFPSSDKSSSEVVVELARDILKNVPLHVDSTRDDERDEMTSQSYSSLTSERIQECSQKDQPAVSLQTTTAQSALNAVLRHEVALFDRLLEMIYSSLKSLCLAVQGEIIMSDSLEETFDALLNNRVPRQWKVWFEQCYVYLLYYAIWFLVSFVFVYDTFAHISKRHK